MCILMGVEHSADNLNGMTMEIIEQLYAYELKPFYSGLRFRSAEVKVTEERISGRSTFWREELGFHVL